MIPELGSFSLILALCFACLQSGMSLLGLLARKESYLRLGLFASFAQFFFLSSSMLFLIISFIQNDWTVIFVREHSHELLPLIYRMGAAWGGHEGSLLLWCLILSGWTLAFILFSALKKR